MLTAFKSVNNFCAKLFPRQATAQENSMDVRQPFLIHSNKEPEIELTMKELELEVEDLSRTRTALDKEGNSRCLRRTSSFIERNKRQVKFRRKPFRATSNASLLITGTSSRVHTIKERFQERVFGNHMKHKKETCSSPKSTQSCEKLDSKEPTKAIYKPKVLNKTQGSFKDTESDDEIGSKIFLPVIVKENESGVGERLQTNSLNVTSKGRRARTKNFKPSSSFKTSLPPIEEYCDCEIFPGSLEKIKQNGYRPSTPLPSLKETNQ